MKKTIYIILLVILCSCDSYLDIVPDNVPTIDYAFRDRAGAEYYLSTCYWYLPKFGDPRYDPAIMGGDDIWSLDDVLYNGTTGSFAAFNIKRQQNINNPYMNYWEGRLQGTDLYGGLRDCNIFLENIDKVGPDLGDSEKKRWIAEVKFLKAYYHYYLLRMYGPIPLVKENFPVDAGINEVRIYRDVFDDCVDYIVQLIDEAVPDLPPVIYDLSNEMGRITQLIALSVKAELLVTAASPLFNENPEFAGMIDNRGVFLFESRLGKQEKWERARIACKEAIDAVNLAGTNRLYDFGQSMYSSSYSGISDTSKLVMTLRTVAREKWNDEIIWGYSNPSAAQAYEQISLPYFTVSHVALIATAPILGPTLRMAELFYTSNGVPIEEDIYYDYTNRYNTETVPVDHKYYILPGHETVKLHLNREPRFYANLGFDGGYWLGNGRRIDPGKLPVDQQAWVTNMKKGEASGNYTSIRYSITGYLPKKGSHFETAVNTASTGISRVQTSTPILRLADLYLLYAEALNESLDTPTQEVYDYVDLIRRRAGLEGVVDSWKKYSLLPEKPTTRDGMREIIQQERLIELAFEGKRFWDIRRWLLAETLMNEPVKGWNTMGETANDYYNVLTLYPLQFNKKEYLWPIRHEELRINANLIQNPGW